MCNLGVFNAPGSEHPQQMAQGCARANTATNFFRDKRGKKIIINKRNGEGGRGELRLNPYACRDDETPDKSLDLAMWLFYRREGKGGKGSYAHIQHTDPSILVWGDNVGRVSIGWTQCCLDRPRTAFISA